MEVSDEVRESRIQIRVGDAVAVIMFYNMTLFIFFQYIGDGFHKLRKTTIWLHASGGVGDNRGIGRNIKVQSC